jgi:uncharacterized repeat protein (TIGR01451 family)
MKKAILLLSCMIFMTGYAQSQFQLGQTLFELYSPINYDIDIAVSNDGSVFVLSNPERSEVKVFEFADKEWRQKGQTISRVSGLSAVLSGDGNTLVVQNESYASVYRWDGIQWAESARPVFDDQTNLLAGAISISNSGDRICLTYDGSHNPLTGYGVHVVFEWNDTSWHILGDPIVISWRVLKFKSPKAELSGDGSSLILGYPSTPFSKYGGMAEVYRYAGNEWTMVGDRIQDSLGISQGVDVSISNDGKVIATSGGSQIKTLTWNGQSWEPKGAPISINGYSGCTIELDDSGDRLAFAEKHFSDQVGYYLGRIVLLEFNGEKWDNIGPHQQGEQSMDRFGTSMGLSGNGGVVVAASDPELVTRQSYIKAFDYGVLPYWPVTFISGSLDACDYERIRNQQKYNIEYNNGQNLQYQLDNNMFLLLAIRDSILIRPIEPPGYSVSPSVSIFDSITLEAYKAIPGMQIRDTFCLIPNDQTTVDVRIDIIIPQSARPGNSLPVILKYSNIGTKSISGNVEFNFEGQLQTITDINPPHDMISANQISWKYQDLLPLESREIQLMFELNLPTSSPPLNGGELLQYSAKVEPVMGDINPLDNLSKAIVEVANSYDPNDKRCMQGDTIRPESVGRPLTYVIRFENNGTAEAIDVRIRDIIDTSMLDISTFEMISASHDGYMVQISKGNIIDFTFKDIYLPFDDENNDGYVAFNIHSKEGLQIGDAIKNDAAIYFDFNYPVITNEAITLVADKATSTTNIQPQVELKVQPNPVRDHTRVTAGAGILRIDLFDPSGRHIRQQVYTRSDEKTRDFNTNGLSQGMYWLRVTTEKGTGAISLIKE